MNSYTILTDSGCDVSAETLAEWGVPFCRLSCRGADDADESGIERVELARRMREGEIFRTSAVNRETYRAAFSEQLSAGNDVLYLGVSSGISGCTSFAASAAEEEAPRHPGRTIRVLDTRCASGGLGLLVWLTVCEKRRGATLAEAAEFAERTAPGIAHRFTVDDLTYLRRGGRISAASAFVGGMLGIRPVLHMDGDGRLAALSKVRGRRASIQALADAFLRTAVNPAGGTVFISHFDCPEDAELLAELLHASSDAKITRITELSPVVGAHAGPGTLALFFPASER